MVPRMKSTGGNKAKKSRVMTSAESKEGLRFKVRKGQTQKQKWRPLGQMWPGAPFFEESFNEIVVPFYHCQWLF